MEAEESSGSFCRLTRLFQASLKHRSSALNLFLLMLLLVTVQQGHTIDLGTITHSQVGFFVLFNPVKLHLYVQRSDGFNMFLDFGTRTKMFN